MNQTADSKAAEAAGAPQGGGLYPPAYGDATAPSGYSGAPPAGYPPPPAGYGPPPAGYAPPPGGYYQPGQPQPGGYGAPPPTVVYVQPPIMTDPPNDYFGYSLCVTLACCWLIGMFAIMRSMECRTAIRTGNRELAVQKSAEAKRLSNIALGVGIGVIILVIIIIIVRIVVFSVY